MLSEALIKTQELANTERGKKKRNGEAGGIHRKQQNSARDGIAGRRERQHGGKNRSDARRPAEREREAEQKSAPDAGLRAAGVQAHVAIQPARHGRTEKTNHRQREEMNCAESGEERSAAEKRDDPQYRKQRSENEAGADRKFDQYAEQMQSEKKNEGAGDWSEQRPVLAKKRADGARGRAERDEHHGKSENKGERRSEETGARRLSLTQLLHANAGEHG